MKRCDKERYLYLVAGFDDAAENTDVLFTLGYDKTSDSVNIAQIPRDTFLNFGSSQNKINQLYASQVCAGAEKYDAMAYTTEYFGKLFGVSFDGFIGLGTSAFRRIVDALGGVEINVPKAMTVEIDGEELLALREGINHLNGAEAEKFIRYRKGYVMGDLERMDAQKLFLSALLKKLSSELTLPTLMKLAGIVQNEAVTNIHLASFSSVVMDAVSDGAKARYITLPGEPALNSKGLSFYVLNRKSAAEIVKGYMFADKDFDPEKYFLNSDEQAFANIYNDDDFEIREYNDTSLPDLKINKRN
jgi:LCP family protein required for cell wall assembly